MNMKQIKRRSAYFSRQARAKPGSCFEFIGISNQPRVKQASLLVIKGVSPGSLREAHRCRLPVRTAGAETGRGMGAVGLFLWGTHHQSDAHGSRIQNALWPRRRRALPAEGPAGTHRVNDDSALSFKGLTRDRVNTVGRGCRSGHMMQK